MAHFRPGINIAYSHDILPGNCQVIRLKRGLPGHFLVYLFNPEPDICQGIGRFGQIAFLSAMRIRMKS